MYTYADTYHNRDRITKGLWESDLLSQRELLAGLTYDLNGANCYTVVTLLSQCCYTLFTLLLHWCDLQPLTATCTHMQVAPFPSAPNVFCFLIMFLSCLCISVLEHHSQTPQATKGRILSCNKPPSYGPPDRGGVKRNCVARTCLRMLTRR
jgi:hypothetical protein